MLLSSTIYFLNILGGLTLSLMANILYENLFYSFLAVMGLWCYVQTFSSHHGRALHCGGFSCCGVQARGHEGLSASWQKGSSQTRDRTDVPCISRRMILTQWTTREVLQLTPYLKSLHCTQALRGTPPGRPCMDSPWPLWPPHPAV